MYRTLALAVAFLSASADAQVEVENFQNWETVRYPVVLLKGTAAGLNLHVAGGRESGVSKFPVIGGRFKALVELKPGLNRLQLKAGKSQFMQALTYKPATTKRRVNVAYLTASDEGTDYITQRRDDPQDYESKLDTALKLMQCMTAESLNTAGMGRRTFALETDKRGRLKVNTIAYPMTGKELRTKSGNDLYGMFYDWIGKRFPHDRYQNVVIMGFTGYDPATKQPLGHTALGGRGMGLFSCNGLFAWPSSLRTVGEAFADTTPIDDKVLWDDSVGRSVAWGLAATTMGATIHEMGHCFRLPHSPDPHSIMSRGFDHFNRVFTLFESPSKRNPTSAPVKPSEEAYWEKPFAALLAFDPWFQPDDVEYGASEVKAALTLEGEVIVTSPSGLGAMLVRGPGDPPKNRNVYLFGNGIRMATFKKEELSAAVGGETDVWIDVVDRAGDLRAFRIADLK